MSIRVQVTVNLTLSMTLEHAMEEYGTTDVESVARQMTAEAGPMAEELKAEPTKKGNEITSATVLVLPIYGG